MKEYEKISTQQDMREIVLLHEDFISNSGCINQVCVCVCVYVYMYILNLSAYSFTHSAHAYFFRLTECYLLSFSVCCRLLTSLTFDCLTVYLCHSASEPTVFSAYDAFLLLSVYLIFIHPLNINLKYTSPGNISHISRSVHLNIS